MLIVKPIEDKKVQEEVCAACGAVYDADALAYAAREDETLIGVCQFKLGAPCAEVLDLKSAAGVEDYEGMFILARGTLNFIDLCGVHRARCRGGCGRPYPAPCRRLPRGRQKPHGNGFDGRIRRKMFALQILKINHSESGSFCRFSFCIDANFYFNVSMYQI